MADVDTATDREKNSLVLFFFFKFTFGPFTTFKIPIRYK